MNILFNLVILPVTVTLLAAILLWLGACFVSLDIVSFYTSDDGGVVGRIMLAIVFGFTFLSGLFN